MCNLGYYRLDHGHHWRIQGFQRLPSHQQVIRSLSNTSQYRVIQLWLRNSTLNKRTAFLRLVPVVGLLRTVYLFRGSTLKLMALDK